MGEVGEGGEKGREMIRIQGSSPSHDMQIRCLAGELAPRICFCGKLSRPLKSSPIPFPMAQSVQVSRGFLHSVTGAPREILP
jgi:hypothetical protein